MFSGSGSSQATIELFPYVDQIHLLRTCDTTSASRFGACRPVVTHADGSLVTTNAPAKAGEGIVLYAFSLGGTMPYVHSGAASPAGAVVSGIFVRFDARPNALAARPFAAGETSPVFAGLVSGYVGLYQINVVVPALPADAAACPPEGYGSVGIQSNLTVSIGGAASFDGTGICAEPAP